MPAASSPKVVSVYGIHRRLLYAHGRPPWFREGLRGDEPELARAVLLDRAPGGDDLGHEARPEQRGFDVAFGEAALGQHERSLGAGVRDRDRGAAGARPGIVVELAAHDVVAGAEIDPVAPQL